MTLGLSLFFRPLFVLRVGGAAKNAVISIEGCEREDGEVEIAVFVESVNGVCGVLLELNYDDEEFLLLTVGAEMCGLDLSYRDDSGKIRILLDGNENSDAECELARLYFKRKNGRSGRAEFALGEKMQAFSLRENELLEEGLSVDVARFCVGEARKGEGGEIECASVDARICENGEVELDFSLDFAGDAFAIGVELFVIDWGREGECYKLFASSVVPLGSEGDIITVRLDASEAFCVVITPILYMGRSVVAGEKPVAVVNSTDGEICVETE